MDVDCVLDCVIPVLFGELGIDEHDSDLVEEHLVHAFCHSIVLRSVWRGHFMFDAFVPQEYLGFAYDVFTPSIGAEGNDMLSGFHFGTGNEPH